MAFSRRILIAGSAAVAAGCATSPAAAPSPEPTSAPASTPAVDVPASSEPPSGQPTTSATTTQPAGGSLLPGTNHAELATPYTFSAAVVHQWLTQPSTQTTPSAEPVGGQGMSTQGRSVTSVPSRKTAFVTFDDGPNNLITPKVLDSLRTLGVPATFFYVAGPTGLASADPRLVGRTFAEGHSVCVHSYSHDYRYLYPRRVGNQAHIMADLDRALAGIRAVAGDQYVSHGFRYPGGHMSWKGLAAADAALAARDMWWLDWNCMSGDAEANPPKTVDAMVAFLDRTLRSSGEPHTAVMLNHDTKSLTLAALPQMIKLLRDRGYTFAVID